MNKISKITFCIPTMLRPMVLFECIRWIKKFHPYEKVLVAEQVPQQKKYRNRLIHSTVGFELLRLPFDCGASFARNRLIENVDTEFCVVLDDDMYIKNSNIDILLKIVKNGEVDICGGLLTNIDGTLQRWDGKLWIEDKCMYFEPAELTAPFVLVDVIPNLFIGKTSILSQVKWCEDFIIGREHIDYFWSVKKAGLKVALAPIIIADHIHYRDRIYSPFRMRNNMKYNNELLLKRFNVEQFKSSTYLTFNNKIEGIIKSEGN